MPRKTPAQKVPFCPTPADVRALDETAAKALAQALADGRDAGLSGQALRDAHGEGCTGPVRRDLFRRFGLDAGRIARSYDAHRDGNPRKGTPRIAVEGSKAQSAFAAAKAEEEAAAKAASKRKAAARKAAATRKARKG
jgi:hypothetical protein